MEVVAQYYFMNKLKLRPTVQRVLKYGIDQLITLFFNMGQSLMYFYDTLTHYQTNWILYHQKLDCLYQIFIKTHDIKRFPELKNFMTKLEKQVNYLNNIIPPLKIVVLSAMDDLSFELDQIKNVSITARHIDVIDLN